MFGRDPTLPIDHLLGLRDTPETNTVDEYLDKLKKRLLEAMESVKQNLEKNAEIRRDQYNRNAEKKTYIRWNKGTDP